MGAEPGQALTLTTDPRLDQAAARSAEDWEAAARQAGASRTAAWLRRRVDQPESMVAIEEAVAHLLLSEDAADLVEARIELAELVEGGDDLLAETLLDAAHAYAAEIGDGEMLAGISSQLAAISERQGDQLTAADYHLDFLNWRRQPGRTSDPDDILSSFDEVIRYADLDGEPAASALYTYRQATFTRLVDAGDERAVEGDWERDGAPYRSWG